MSRAVMQQTLEAYLSREMPAGTVIGDPKWWAPKIAAVLESALAQTEQEDAKDAMISIGHQYLFASPFGGDVWRDNSNEWNGLRPKESREIYAVRGGAA